LRSRRDEEDVCAHPEEVRLRTTAGAQN